MNYLPGPECLPNQGFGFKNGFKYFYFFWVYPIGACPFCPCLQIHWRERYLHYHWAMNSHSLSEWSYHLLFTPFLLTHFLFTPLQVRPSGLLTSCLLLSDLPPSGAHTSCLCPSCHLTSFLPQVHPATWLESNSWFFPGCPSPPCTQSQTQTNPLSPYLPHLVPPSSLHHPPVYCIIDSRAPYYKRNNIASVFYPLLFPFITITRRILTRCKCPFCHSGCFPNLKNKST